MSEPEVSIDARFGWRVPHAAAGALISLLLGACGPSGQSGPAAQASAAPPPLQVGVLRAEPRKLPVLLESVGRAEGSREVEIRARVTGILQKQHYREGEPVAAGAKLYAIDPAPFEIALAQARAALSQERARLERAQIEAKRLRQLNDERAISQREYDDAAATLRQLEAAALAAEARVREAELNLSYTSVAAPIAGITGRAQRSEGSLVTAGSESSLLTTLTRTDPIWVRFALSETEYAQLRTAGRAGEVTLRLPDGSAFPATGKVNFAASTVDSRLGTVQLRAEFPNAKLALLPGQFVRARVEAGEREGVLVPQQAVLQNEQGAFVWLVGSDGKAVARPVETGNWSGKDWVIRSGLKAGDQVIVDNLLKVRPGAPVQPRGAAPTTPTPVSPPAADKSSS